MARAASEQPTDVSDSSETSGQAEPMKEAPPEPTDAQAEQGAETQAVGVNASVEPSDAAVKQAKEDEEFRQKNPNKVLIRAANPEFGGEGFEYGGKPKE